MLACLMNKLQRIYKQMNCNQFYGLLTEKNRKKQLCACFRQIMIWFTNMHLQTTEIVPTEKIAGVFLANFLDTFEGQSNGV